jgi:asparagine synthase (glutamine-hydrolysing)
MCGIYGIAGAIRPVDRAVAAEMDRRLAHRGPDDSGIRESPLGLLGMRRLSIIDLAGGHQPLCEESGQIWVTLNGEIYNYRELRLELESKGHRFTTASDTEVVAHAYEAYGDDFLIRLRGMFALAIADERRGRVLVARDRIGKKPLYYAEVNGRLFYASELKAVLAAPEVSRDIDRRALWHYLTFKNVPAPMTIFSGVYALAAGSVLTIETGCVSARSYWRPRFDGTSDLTIEEAADRLLDLLREAVGIRVAASDVPVAAYLSGGVDSSLVVSLMADLAPKPLQTFSLGYVDRVGHKNDVEFARRVSQQFGTEHHELEVTTEQIVSELPEVVKTFDEPFGGTITSYWLSRLIGARVKVALSGDGADELFGSYADHRMAATVQHLRSTASRSSADYAWFDANRALADRCASEPDAVWRTRFAGFTDDEKLELVAPQLRGFERSSDALGAFYEEAEGDSVNATLEVDCRTLLPDQVLTYADRLSMAHSLEVRVPFLDHRVIEFVGTLPGSYKVTQTQTKRVLKDVARRVLPADVVDRPKEGFVLPIDAWLEGPLRPFVREAFSSRRLAHGYFEPRIVSRFVDEHYAHKANHTYKIFTLLMFQLWHHLYVEGKAFSAVDAALGAQVAL